ncbi:MAG: hypothetical protein AB8D52_08300 [Gammaproteobacteria bacterium]
MSENSNLSDLTLKQLLQLYKTPTSSRGEGELKGKVPASQQEDIDKFSSIASDRSVDPSLDNKIDQNLARIVDDLIKKIGS